MLPPLPRGDQYSGKICFIEKPGVQDEGDRHVAKGSSDPRVALGIVASFAPRGQYSSVFGTICLIEKPEVPDEGDHHLSKRSSDPRLAYPEVKVQVRDLVRVVDTVAPFAL